MNEDQARGCRAPQHLPVLNVPGALASVYGVHPSRNPLNRPLTLRTALVCLGAVGVLAALVLSWPHVRRWWEARPKSPEGKVEAVFAYLERKSKRSDFKSAYDFDLRGKVTGLQSNATELQARRNAEPKAAQAARREAAAAEQALARQGAEFAREMRKAIKDGGSYEAIYAAIGQWLWTGQRLLESTDPRVQRLGAQYVDEAAQAALRGAEDAGLAAQICEALIWPNLARFDLPGQGTAAADAVLGNCRDAFQRAGTTNLLERNYALMLEHAPTPRRKDSIRYSLGSFHEDAGAWQAALSVYRQIEDTNYVRQAERRIEVVERKLAQGR